MQVENKCHENDIDYFWPRKTGRENVSKYKSDMKLHRKNIPGGRNNIQKFQRNEGKPWCLSTTQKSMTSLSGSIMKGRIER